MATALAQRISRLRGVGETYRLAVCMAAATVRRHDYGGAVRFNHHTLGDHGLKTSPDRSVGMAAYRLPKVKIVIGVGLRLGVHLTGHALSPRDLAEKGLDHAGSYHPHRLRTTSASSDYQVSVVAEDPHPAVPARHLAHPTVGG